AQQLSASVELVRTATGEQAWSSLIRRRDDDIAAIEVQVAESVAVAVGGRLAPAQVALLQRKDTRDPDAYRLYLNAPSLAVRRTQNDIPAAVLALQQAVRLDPAFAQAWARLSIARSLQSQYGNNEGLTRDSVMALSRIAGDRALSLDSTSAEAWLARGHRYTLLSDFGVTWLALTKAVQLDSLSGDIEHALG